MAEHRIAFYFLDEAAGDVELWRGWIANAPPPIRAAATFGARRPMIAVTSPFPARVSLETTRASDEAGLELTRTLVAALHAFAIDRRRSIALLFGGARLGTVSAAGPDAAITEHLREWQRRNDARPADPVAWRREGYVSIWAGDLDRDAFDALLEERYTGDGPISSFARALGIRFYDHDALESVHAPAPASLAERLSSLSFADSFLGAVPDAMRAVPVTAVILLFDTDFSARPCDVARRRMRFIGSFPYRV